MRVLLVEDDELIGKGIVAGLRKHGISVQHVLTAQDAETVHAEETFHALVLDLGLPDRDGMELLASMRAVEPQLPVLILTARDAIEHRLKGLHDGADDYMVKPFDLRELAARLHALVRRTQGRAAQVISAGPLRLEPESGLAWFQGEAVTLSRREVDLLAHLANADGRWVPPDMLNERLYGLGEEIGSNALNVHIHNIRRKLGAEAIETVRGLGYRLGWRLTS
ncbi:MULTISPECIES: response regulator [Pseudomonadota]|jgi:DNA-binding response OmpR family regulator|uniref:Response regulator transcription factor n=5 Tax=Pseudomonadota TaxID=1224 RepID=A0A7Y1A486_PSEVE|nr:MULTISPECIES: response regulator transcription factor [Pseudomonadota]ABM41575.1 two component transcriptional regulator, winged helix family [Acidovorax sp. JS42]MCW0203729.1 response regulator transcription factor [Rhodanobacter thiooxydans]AOY65851.1 DNA-binding response regulator [Xanthomonas euvesicatoria pv. vesicatoria str. 85-10]AQQ19615.1 DNA-binding response regulator [Burkholderia cenocepacia]KLB39767.1 transcriptional regulator [Xanthomonas euvesicatoria]